MAAAEVARWGSARRMEDAAAALLGALDREQAARARFSMDDEVNRTAWYYTPNERPGVPLSDLGPAQQQLAHRLVATGLSAGGYATMSAILGLENALDALEGWGTVRGRFRRRDPNRYYVSVFGEPGSEAWGWGFGGHHVSLHYTIVEHRVVAPTPTFFGANPAELSTVGRTPLRPLADEEDLARELLHALDAEQRATAVLSPAAPDDLMQRNLPRVDEGARLPEAWEMMGRPTTPEAVEAAERNREQLGLTPERLEALRYTVRPKGLPAGSMRPDQRDAVRALVAQYLDRLPEDVAAFHHARIDGVLESVHFAWAGGAERREPHYYRLQGPRFLVEYDNTQDGANHIHSVWRDPEGDFGADLLAAHYAAAH